MPERISAASFVLNAMSLEVPETPDHPNKRPFSGILTRIDEPSDGPPGGSRGRLVMLTKAAAEAALPTLLGMAIDCSADLSDHAETNKIGVITSAEIEGNAIVIAGHLFEKDFPQLMRDIDKQKSKLGFSYELTPTKAAVSAENVLVIEAGVFTGAALLFKSKAAYKSTSLAAGDTQENEMELKDLIEAVAKLTAAQEEQSKALKALGDKIETGGGLKSSVECRELVEPHAARLEAAAAAMKKDGIGLHPTHGHVKVLHDMAGKLRAEAALGRIPHIYRDHDYPMTAGDDSARNAPAMDAATKKVIDDLAAAQKTTTDALSAIQTQLKDMKAAQRDTTAAPERKTLPSSINSLLARHGVNVQGEDGKFLDDNALSAALSKAGMPPEDRMIVKNAIGRLQSGRPA